MIFCFFTNDLPLWKVPGILSWQHVFLILFALSYVALLAYFVSRLEHRFQDLVIKVLAISCAVVFCGRFFWGYDSLIYTPQHERTGFWYGTLVPLELCNLGIPFLIIAAFKKTRFWYVVCFYVTCLGGFTAFICFPYSHQWPTSTILNFQFFDYYYIHAHLMGLPLCFIACGSYKPKLKDVRLGFGNMFVITAALALISMLLNAIYNVSNVNYMWTMGEKRIPGLAQLWELIGIPFVYMLPLMPLIIGLHIVMTLPFIPKGMFKKQFRELCKIYPDLQAALKKLHKPK